MIAQLAFFTNILRFVNTFSNFANIGGSAIRKKNINGTAFYPYGISIAEGDTMSEKAMNYLIDKVGVSKSTLEAVKNILIEE